MPAARKSRQSLVVLLALSAICMAGDTVASSEAQNLGEILARANEQTAAFLDQFSEVKCTEEVRQEKLGKDNKVELKEDSSYDYLVILTNSGGELSLSESRLPLHQAKLDRRRTPMLLSNGFATLFLVFHPYYSRAFRFKLAGEEILEGRRFDKIGFEHVRGMKTPAALALRGREYPLELSGAAWIDPETGTIAKIEADIGDSLKDVGLQSLHAEIQFAPVPFGDTKPVYWFPAEALVEVQTPRQHWRNFHHFGEYKKFSVSTEQKVITQ
ncbi:MAG TPA: hypothetical protein VFO39_21515 [Candidatus Sulfotelmatobacter sp.]|nr:hypothetical protein [Candidatus Sulfotelmatobacter sp.]